jgi:putative glutathione S-transferase
LACPWASRTVIVRKLKGLEDAISLTVVDPVRDDLGWAFRDTSGEIPPSAPFESTDQGTNNYREGFQSPPVNWNINTLRKEAFVNLLSEMSGAMS